MTLAYPKYGPSAVYVVGGIVHFLSSGFIANRTQTGALTALLRTCRKVQPKPALLIGVSLIHTRTKFAKIKGSKFFVGDRVD
jgi:hypothetical protein